MGLVSTQFAAGYISNRRVCAHVSCGSPYAQSPCTKNVNGRRQTLAGATITKTGREHVYMTIGCTHYCSTVVLHTKTWHSVRVRTGGPHSGFMINRIPNLQHLH